MCDCGWQFTCGLTTWTVSVVWRTSRRCGLVLTSAYSYFVFAILHTLRYPKRFPNVPAFSAAISSGQVEVPWSGNNQWLTLMSTKTQLAIRGAFTIHWATCINNYAYTCSPWSLFSFIVLATNNDNFSIHEWNENPRREWFAFKCHFFFPGRVLK